MFIGIFAEYRMRLSIDQVNLSSAFDFHNICMVGTEMPGKESSVTYFLTFFVYSGFAGRGIMALSVQWQNGRHIGNTDFKVI